VLYDRFGIDWWNIQVFCLEGIEVCNKFFLLGAGESCLHITLQTFVISPKEKTTVWVKQNVNFFQQNGSVVKIEQN
jgi:hypothetical protein